MQNEDLQRAALKALLDQRAAGAFITGAQMDKSISQRGAAPMRFRIEFSAEAERDFGLIYDHLFDSYLDFGESVEAALDHCEARIRNIREEADRLVSAGFAASVMTICCRTFGISPSTGPSIGSR